MIADARFRAPAGKTKKMTLVAAIQNALETEMALDESVLVLGEDVGKDGGVFRATDALLERFGSERVIDTPLAESGIVGTSVGLALMGMRPVAEIQFQGFIYPAVNQLFAHAARYRNRTRGNFTVPLVLRMPYGGGIHAPEHHSESYESLLVNTPGLQVVIPSNPYDAKGLLIHAIRQDDPVVFMEPKRYYRAFRGAVPLEAYEIPFGQAAVPRVGGDVTIIAYGAMVPVAMDAAAALAEEGVEAEVLDLRSVNPLDREAILQSVEKTGRAVVVHEAPRSSGFGAEIVALINEHSLLHLLAPVQRVTGFDTVFPYALLESHYLPTPARVIAAVRETLAF